MTVAELISILQTAPADALVLVLGRDGCEDVIEVDVDVRAVAGSDGDYDFYNPRSGNGVAVVTIR